MGGAVGSGSGGPDLCPFITCALLQCKDFFNVFVKRVEAEIRNILENYEDIFNQNVSTALRNMCRECKYN